MDFITQKLAPRIKHTLQSEWFVLLAIILAAVCIRFYQLDKLPPGLYHDEAVNANDALSVLDGDHPLYFEANNGREPLYVYLLAISISLLGATPFAIRVVSAILGTLFIVTVYWLGRELGGRQLATYSACLTTISIWAINLSRVGFRAVSYLPITTAALALLVRSQKRSTSWTAVSAGTLLGLSLYTYLVSRVGALALGLIVLYLFVFHRHQTWWRGVLLTCVSAILVSAPLIVYWLLNWQETFGRASQVSILNPAISAGQPAQMLTENLLKTVLAFFWRGDFIPRHNVPLQPVFNPLIAILFALGLVLLILRARRNAIAGSILIWLGIMLIPTIIAEDAPHFLRASGILPVLYIVPAAGMVAIAHRFGRSPIINIALSAILALSAALGPGAYIEHLQSDTVYYQFESAATELAARANAFAGAGWQGNEPEETTASSATRKVYIAPRFFDSWQSISYLTAPAQKQQLVTNSPSELEGAQDVMLIFWPYEPWEDLLPYLPHDRLISTAAGGQELGDLETAPRLLNAVIWSSPISTPANINADLGDIELVGYSVEQESSNVQISLYWHCKAPVESSLSVFVHLLESDTILSQDDGPLALGYYGTEHWRPGDVIKDTHTLPLESDLTLDGLTARIGLYHWDTLERLPVSYQKQLSTWVEIPIGMPIE